MKRSHATPLIILVGCLILLLNLAIHVIVLASPYLKRLATALYRGARVYLNACLVVTSTNVEAFAYYCLPVQDEGLVDTFCKILIADISLVIAYLGRLGSRICE